MGVMKQMAHPVAGGHEKIQIAVDQQLADANGCVKL